MSLPNILINGTGTFQNTSQNYGELQDGVFQNDTINIGTINNTGAFIDSSLNSGVVSVSASFANSSKNTLNGIIQGSAVFADTTENVGTVSNAVFNDMSLNTGTVSAQATFTSNASSTGIVNIAEFTGTSINTGIVSVATFASTSVNAGIISTSAVFLDGASNTSTGQVQSAVFKGTSINAGTIIGDAVFDDSSSSVEGSVVTGTIYIGVSATVVSTAVQGTSAIYYNHVYQHDAYWSDDAILDVGSSLYTTQHGSTLAGSGNFVDGGDTVTFVDGLVTQIQAGGSGYTDALAAAAHTYGQYESTGRWYVNGDYVGASETVYTDAIDALAFDTNGQYESTGRWYYGGVYVGASESDVIDALAAAVSFYGQYESTGRWYVLGVYVAANETDYNTAVDALASTASTYGQYELSGRWYINGDYVGASESAYIDALASTAYTYGQYGSTGRWYVNGTYVGDETAYNAAYDHSYPHDSYWSDDTTLVNGSILYTGQHSSTLATNVSFDIGTQTIDTDGSGVVSIGYKWAGATTCNSGIPLTLYTTSTSLATGVTLRLDRAFSARVLEGGSFAYSGYLYYTNGQGVMTSILACTPYN